MSNFKIYAKKGKKVMPIKIEEKHIYEHTATVNTETSLSVYKPDANAAADNVVGYGVNRGNIHTLYNSNNLHITQGTAENQRIGNKVNVKSLSIALYIRFNSNILISTFSHGQLIDTFFNFRIMTVRFDQPMSSTDLAQWYRETFIYYRLVDISAGEQYPYQSNWMDKLRESTRWTGSFQILNNKKFQLTKTRSVIQMNYNVPLKGNVNFDNTSNRPTDNQKFSNVYVFLIGPSNAYLDMDAVSTDKVLNMANADATLFYLQANIKTIYYDM